MPLWFSPSPNYRLLARCREQVRAEMLASKWISSQSKFEKVLTRRAWKLYNRTITHSH